MRNLWDDIDWLANTMDEFKLDEAEFESDGFRVSFHRKRKATMVAQAPVGAMEVESGDVAPEAPEEVPEAITGVPVTSPMNGIFYGSPSPSAPALVNVGDSVTAGQVIALIEAMKVFNEIPSPASGMVKKIGPKSGDMVQPGDVLFIIG